MKPTLPVDAILPDIIARLQTQPSLVLKASPGTGKTTRVPPALLSAPFVKASEDILVLEPRRLAAKYAARRVADELGEAVGKTVGYQFRFENVTSPETRIRFLTEGMLIRRLLSDPELRGTAVVILDEFHERHLHTDVSLAYLRRLQNNRRPDLKIVVMSATLDTDSLAKFLGDAPILEIKAKLHDVEITYLPMPSSHPLDILVRNAVRDILLRPLSESGDILVFLPGMAEIRRCERAILGLNPEAKVVILHGDLSREEQDFALRKNENRKIILSTNVAETSLTIEGVRTVVDSGLHRQASYSWWSGMPALKTRPISKASAIQRMGRAGRTAPGLCYRLYTKGEYDGLSPFETPEIQRADLTQTLLELTSLNIGDLSNFTWFNPPPAGSVETAIATLKKIGALNDRGHLTEVGRKLACLPAHPRIGRVLLAGIELGIRDEAASLAAAIAEDRIETLDALEGYQAASKDEGVRRAKSQLLSSINAAGPAKTSTILSTLEEKLAFSLLTGFPDRVAIKREVGSKVDRVRAHEIELVFSSGGSARVEETGPFLESDAFVVLELQERQRLGDSKAQLKVRSVAKIRAEWLLDVNPSPLRETETLGWNASRRCISCISRLHYDDLILSESESEPTDKNGTAVILLKHGLGIDPNRLPGLTIHDWAESLKAEPLLARLSLIQEYLKPPDVEPLHAKTLTEKVMNSLSGKTLLEELEAIDWESELAPHFAGQNSIRMHSLVPISLQLPSGRNARIHYRLGQIPWVESRLQDFFGMTKTPKILNDRVPLLLHLLAPNQRPVQVTQDLANFWNTHYPALRPALSRRYPRHAWPVHPLDQSK